MRELIVDTSAWVDFFRGETIPALETALEAGLVVVPPIVIAELVSGAHRPAEASAILDLLATLEVHPTPWDHWVAVGFLRKQLAEAGLTVSTPDAHVAQCALDRRAALLSRDRVFERIVALTSLERLA